jgi:DNA-binding transcriptional MerR regulator
VLRPVDLAREAGISAQQVRNYLDAGVLPPADRSPAGYRRFDERHRAALLTYRALGKAHGWPAARAVLRAVNAGDVPRALAVVDEGHAGLHEQRRLLAATVEALEAVAGDPPDASVPRAGLRVGEVAARLGVRPSALRVWESAGLLTARRDTDGHRRYGAAELRDARLVHMLRQGRYPLPQVASIMEVFRRSGGVEALRRAIVEREGEIGRRAVAMLEASALLHRYVNG